MEEVEITWLRVTKIWWSLIWRGVIYGLILGIVISIPLSMGAAALSLDQAQAERVIQNITGICGLLLGIWVLKIVLGKNYSDFRIALLPSDEALLDHVKKADNGSIK